MSKNIDEIVKEIVPLRTIPILEWVQSGERPCDWALHGVMAGYARNVLKQALTEKKLVVPLSEEALFTIIRRYVSAWEIDLVTKSQKDLAKEIYEAQFNDKQ